METTTKETTAAAAADELFVVDDGCREIPVWNTLHEQIGTLRYNPTDFNMVNRFMEVEDKFSKILAPVANANINANGKGDDDDSLAILNTASDQLIELLDYVLASDSRRAFFAVTNPFSPSNGVFYCEAVIEQLGNFISKVFGTEMKKVNTRIAKQTHGYRSGKHAKGRA